MADADCTVYGIIYCVENKVNGKKYIGQTTRSIEQRLKGHFYSRGKNGCRILYAAIVKYGKESFEISEIATACCQKDLDDIEIDLIKKHRTTDRDIGYNIAIGGYGGKQSAETVARRVEKTKGQKRSEDFCKNVSLHRTGKTHSDEAKLKISEAAKKRGPISDETRAKLSEAGKKSEWTQGRRDAASARMVGYVLSEESRKKISATLTGRRQSEETILKRVSANTGKTRSEETKNRISEARINYWKRIREEKLSSS